ncbi:MAG: 50S ribosome-binding GTPase [Planctomycetota bacterium]|nr:50S ribosome-binding GTPase [Planctomycetota bacterium]
MTEPSAPSAFAVLTPPGRGGIAVIRCSGPAAETALAKCFRLAHSSPERKLGVMPSPGQLSYGHIVDAEGRPIDEVILYNAGTAFEVNCHGGPAAVRAVCERLADAGLPEVDADSLMQIEGLPHIVQDARRALRRVFTPLAARILLDQLNGALAGAITEILAPLGPGANEAIDALLDRWRTCGRFLADPPRIVIAGRPNAGKSTLLNRLVGAERAITSAAPGTTRDYVEAEAALEGAPALLVDTAGLRDEPGGEIERQGIERARQELARAAVVIYLIDAGEGANPEDKATLQSLGDRTLVVLSKIDAAGAEKGTVPFSQQREKGTAPFSALAIAALTGEGMPALVAAVLEKLAWRAPRPGDAVPFAADQAAALAAAREALAAGRVDEAMKHLKALLAV